ncbi:MAG: DUF4783 domain-containing protein [Gemmatimonadetes bacterium]|nr:DUF4783 domain-containing protein [Gemmatimonadota bacterium]MBT8403593.1 DUF4783 domain-containing protein [Gemmatimonadota bacterium]NNF37854.1 hypothetical protein [Gemmatimonadota bacterium]NNK62955.1 hypothetical protein [Gemmatimonadota bacterium]
MTARSRLRGWIQALAALILASVVPAGSAHAQTDLSTLTESIARAWSRGDAEALTPHLSDQGLDLSLDGEAHTGVSRRQARAALAGFLADWDPETVSVRQSENLGGEPVRALLEFGWEPTARGTPERRSFVIFVSLQRTLEAWRIEEIRVFS